MPDETRQPDPLEARAKEIVREYFAYLRGQQTYPPMIALERMVLSALRAVQQETVRKLGQHAEGWHRAVETICTIVGVSPALSADESVVAVRERVEAIRQETARATWEQAASIADQWAHSASCAHHEDNPCCHVRAGAGIAAAIRQAATPPEDQR
jgi:hypothetical protein